MASESFSDDDSWDVPDYLDEITVIAEGEGTGANGGRVEGTLNVTGGETLYIRRTAGGEGGESTSTFEDRAQAYGQDGGDAIDLRQGGSDEGDIVALGAGSGGDADGDGTDYDVTGGAPGGDPGEDAEDASYDSSDADGGHGGESGSLEGTDGQDSRAYYADGVTVAVAGGGGGAGYNGGTGGEAEAHDEGEGAYDYVDGAAGGGGGGDNYAGGLDSVTSNETGVNGGGPSLVIEYQINPPSGLAVDDFDDTSITISWDDVEDAEEYDVYRHTSSGAHKDGDVVETVSDDGSSEYSYTDEVDNGTEYYYQVVAVDNQGDDSDPSDEVSVTTDLPAPTDLAVESVDGDQITVSWTDNASDEDGYRVHVSRDGGETWTQDGDDLAPDTEEYETTELLDGERYRFAVEVFTEDTETITAPGLREP